MSRTEHALGCLAVVVRLAGICCITWAASFCILSFGYVIVLIGVGHQASISDRALNRLEVSAFFAAAVWLSATWRLHRAGLRRP
jgi:hypothetical protein